MCRDANNRLCLPCGSRHFCKCCSSMGKYGHAGQQGMAGVLVYLMGQLPCTRQELEPVPGWVLKTIVHRRWCAVQVFPQQAQVGGRSVLPCCAAPTSTAATVPCSCSLGLQARDEVCAWLPRQRQVCLLGAKFC
jgi:hypothetical protein